MGKARKIKDEHEARRCFAAVRRRRGPGSLGASAGVDGRSLHAWWRNLVPVKAAAQRAGRPEEGTGVRTEFPAGTYLMREKPGVVILE